jgi:hypothetical protein
VSTQINVTVGSGGLSDKAKQLQAAARQAQLEKERTAQIEADGTEQRNARLAANGQAPDGTSLYGVPTVVPFAERRPAAFRIPSRGSIGLSWFAEGGEQYYYGDTYDGYVSGGNTSKYINERYQGSWNTFNVAFAGPNDSYSCNRKTPVQFGCGDGSQWVSFDFGLTGVDYSAISQGFTDLLVQDDYRLLTTGETAKFGTLTISECTTAHLENSSLSYDWLVLPAGKDNHIIIFYGVATYDYVEVTGLYYHFEKTSSESFIWPDGPPWFLNGSNFYPNGLWFYNSFNNTYSWFYYPPEYRVEYWGETAYSFSGWAKPYPLSGNPPLSQFNAFDRGLVSITSNYGRQKTTKAFVVSNTAIREIAVPARMQHWIDEVTDESTNSQTIEFETRIRSKVNGPEGPSPDGYLYVQTKYPSQSVQLQFYYGNGNGEGIEPYNEEPFTPAVYAMMNNQYQFTDPANIKSFPATQKYILEDWNIDGTFKSVNSDEWCPPYGGTATGYIYEDYYKQGATFSYAYWNANAEYPYPDYAYGDSDCWGGDVNPYPPVTNIKPKIAISPRAVARPGIPWYVETFGYKEYINESFIVVNDWNDPQYCRQMLLALGFSTDDLKP